MPVTTQLDTLMFPVEEHPVFAHVQKLPGEKRVRRENVLHVIVYASKTSSQ